MTRRGVLLGSATGGLTGVAHDLAVTGRWLDDLGFTLDVRQGADATRRGMLEGIERLIRDTTTGDAAVIYYSGHGGYSQIANDQRVLEDRIAPRSVQYLVPTDHDKHVAFRGIFRAELSLAMQRLADETSNITMILDCCHSPDMVRDDDALLKGRKEPWGEGLEDHITWMAEQGCDVERLPRVRNPSLVLLSACEMSRQAFEVSRASDGVRCSLFTDSLLEVMSRLAIPYVASWNELMRRVVERMSGHRVHQRPQVSGPSARIPFSERSRRHIAALTLCRAQGRWFLEGGEAAGVMPGDRYRVIDPLRNETGGLADVEVSDVDSHRATVTFTSGPQPYMEAGMLALPHPGGPVHLLCRVDGETPLAARLRERLANVAGFGLIYAEDSRTPALMLEVNDDHVRIEDGEGKDLRRAWRGDRFDALIGDLRRISRAEQPHHD